MKKKFVLIACLILSAFSFVAKADTYVVAVGIADYQHISDLWFAENDAKSIAGVFQKRTTHVVTLTGQAATRVNIIKNLGTLFLKAQKDDTVIFFFSGHGYDGGFCPYDTGLMNENALSYQEIYAIFRRTKATHKIIYADACLSGKIRKEKSSQTTSQTTTSSDVVLFLSCRSNEISVEDTRTRNGYFTTYLSKGLKGKADANNDKVITAKEIFSYVSSNVKKISKDEQHPVMWGKFHDDFVMIDWR